MEATLNALGLLFVIGLTVFLIVKFRGPITSHKTILAFLAGLGFYCFNSLLNTTFSGGIPLTQYFISGICLTLVLMFLPYEKRLQRYAGAIIIISLGLLLSYQFTIIGGVNSSDTSDPNGVRRHNHLIPESLIREVQVELKSAKNRNEVIPAGWFTDTAVQKHLPEELFVDDSLIYFSPLETYPLWHSWLTRIYGKRKTAQEELWYPGGTISSAVDKIEFRKRN